VREEFDLLPAETALFAGTAGFVAGFAADFFATVRAFFVVAAFDCGRARGTKSNVTRRNGRPYFISKIRGGNPGITLDTTAPVHST